MADEPKTTVENSKGKSGRASVNGYPPVKGMKLVPMGLPLMLDAWLGCVVWCAAQEEHSSVFRKETGLDINIILKRSVMDAMIDKATGFDGKVIAAFCDWVTERVWGEEENG